jgi:hypothetical protein
MNVGLIVRDEDLPCGLSLYNRGFRFFGKKKIIGLIVCYAGRAIHIDLSILQIPESWTPLFKITG